jgi:hypothetical protein
VKKLTTIVEQACNSEMDRSKCNSKIPHTKDLHPKPMYCKEINNANREQTQKINYFIEKELKWLDSNEYVLRKKEATGMSEIMIKRDVEKIKEQLAKTKINILYEKADLASGVYSQDKKNLLCPKWKKYVYCLVAVFAFCIIKQSTNV